MPHKEERKRFFTKDDFFNQLRITLSTPPVSQGGSLIEILKQSITKRKKPLGR